MDATRTARSLSKQVNQAAITQRFRRVHEMRITHCGPYPWDDDLDHEEEEFTVANVAYTTRPAARDALAHREASVVALTEYYSEQMARQEFLR